MHFINRLKRYLLVSVLCVTTVFSMPVQAKTKSKSNAQKAAEQAAAAALQAEVDARYNKEIDSNSWENWPAGPQVYAESAIVMEASTGTILYAKGIDEQHYPASITKIMTVLLALENCQMDEEVTFSHNAVYSIDYGSSSIARDEGEVLTVEECLYAIMLESANECANAIAEHISGSTEEFANLMNQRAAELGCTNTHFANPSGLPNEDHYTSAHDMALITSEATKHEEFRKISGTSRYVLRATNKKSDELLMNNHHYMISGYKTSKYLDPTVFAGKTGYTTAALNTLVTCATRNGMDLVVVTMKSQGTAEKGVPIYPDTQNLLNYATENFQKVNIAENETNFTIGQNQMFDAGTSIFGNSAPMIQMNTEGYAILPVTASLSDATPSLTFNDNGDGTDSDIIATLSYSYAGQTVGSTNLYMAGTTDTQFPFSNTENASDAADGSASQNHISTARTASGMRVIKINLRVIAWAGGTLAALIIVILLGRKIMKNYSIRFDFITKWRKRADRNSFSSKNRKRYKSRKRWKNNFFKKFK